MNGNRCPLSLEVASHRLRLHMRLHAAPTWQRRPGERLDTLHARWMTLLARWFAWERRGNAKH